MKKIFYLLIILCIALFTSSCGKKETNYKLGMGAIVSLESSKEATAQINGTIAAVVVDENGKIVNCYIDAIENEVNVATTLDLAQEFKTKMELGEDYHMDDYAQDCNKDWYIQATNFANYCIGKTVNEVEAIETISRNDGLHDGYIVAADEELFAQCSIQIDDLKKAVVKACNDELAAIFSTNGTITLGVKISSWIDASSTIESVNIYSDFAATAIVDGKIAAALTDGIQPKITIVDNVIEDGIYSGTKRELGEDYHMDDYAQDCNKDWYIQGQNFTNYVVGKTADEVEAIETISRNDGLHDGYIVAANEELFAQCSIQISSMKAVVANAARNAK